MPQDLTDLYTNKLAACMLISESLSHRYKISNGRTVVNFLQRMFSDQDPDKTWLIVLQTLVIPQPAGPSRPS